MVYLIQPTIAFTDHARHRMQQRGISQRDAEMILDIGIQRPGRDGTTIHSIREPRRGAPISYRRYCLLGIHIVCNANDCVVTVYRDHVQRDSYAVLSHLAGRSQDEAGITIADLLEWKANEEDDEE